MTTTKLPSTETASTGNHECEDLNSVIPPKSPYMFYKTLTRHHYVQENSDAEKMIEERWNKLNLEDKKPFQWMAENDKARYQKEIDQYQKCNPTTTTTTTPTATTARPRRQVSVSVRPMVQQDSTIPATKSKKRVASSRQQPLDKKKETKKKKRCTLKEHRRIRKSAVKKKIKITKKEATQVDGEFYEVEKIIGMRNGLHTTEYLVRWRGTDPTMDSWEPEANLCDSALEDAIKFRQKEELRRKRLMEGEASLVFAGSKVEDVYIVPGYFEDNNSTIQKPEKVECNKKPEPEEDNKKNDTSTDHKIDFQSIQRINVNDANAKERVTEARINGTPIVLVGQKGWPQFPSRWLRQDGDSVDDSKLLDLSQPHTLDIECMVEDIGNESVPILKKNYDERKPIVKETFASTFLRQCWPPEDGCEPKIKGLYLHQWQFPMSETAAAKLCGAGKCATIPNVFNEDLLQYWMDMKENPYQYLFMGEEGTMSKMHKDDGGLEITIAPIIGKKECILVHRLDGEYCLYALRSKLDDLQLDKYPMTSFARVYKSVIEPGEILLMPQGTYHQCRNLTPCLSYHKFHLDSVNLLPFLKSFLEGDAKEIEHDAVVWNCAIELIERVEQYVTRYRAKLEPATTSVPDEIIRTVETLKQLRPVCCQIANSFDFFGRQTLHQPKNSVFLQKTKEDSHHWPRMVEDIDLTIHDFNHRNANEVPKFQRVTVNTLKKSHQNADQAVTKALAELEDANAGSEGAKSARKNNNVSATIVVERVIKNLPPLQPFQEGVVIPDSIKLNVGDDILIHLFGKQASAHIVQIEDQMKALYLTYANLPSCFDEFQPKDNVQVLENENTLCKENHARQKQVVSCRVGGKGKPQRATVTARKCATFYLVRLNNVGQKKIERWVNRESIISKVEK